MLLPRKFYLQIPLVQGRITHAATLRRLIERKKIPSYRIGRAWRLNVEEVLQSLKLESNPSHYEKEVRRTSSISDARTAPGSDSLLKLLIAKQRQSLVASNLGDKRGTSTSLHQTRAVPRGLELRGKTLYIDITSVSGQRHRQSCKTHDLELAKLLLEKVRTEFWKRDVMGTKQPRSIAEKKL